MSRKYTVTVSIESVTSSNRRSVDVVMYSNPGLSDIADICDDFTDKLDNPNSKYFLTLAADERFGIAAITDNKKNTHTF